MKNVQRCGNYEVGVLQVYKLKIERPIRNKNAIPLMFLAVVKKGASPQHIKYEDLKRDHPQILIDFYQKKMKINGIIQMKNQSKSGDKQLEGHENQIQEETSHKFRKSESSEQESSNCQWSEANLKDFQKSDSKKQGKLQVRITQQRSSRLFQPRAETTKRFIKQDGTCAKYCPKGQQAKKNLQADVDFFQAKDKQLQYDDTLMQLKYSYGNYYERVIQKGILHTKNQMPQHLRTNPKRQNAQKKKSTSKSKSKSRGRSKIKRKKSGKK